MDPERTLMSLLISLEEKEWLERLVELDGGGGKSAYIRRLIRREAVRNGLTSQAAWAVPAPLPPSDAETTSEAPA
jgi:hypothetical protein